MGSRTWEAQKIRPKKTKKQTMPKRNHNRELGFTTEQADSRDDRLEFEGRVEEALPGTLFRVKTTLGTTVLCTLSGKLRINRIRLLVGDSVRIECSPYDTSRGRVVWRV